MSKIAFRSQKDLQGDPHVCTNWVVCNIIWIFNPTQENPIILNLPALLEMEAQAKFGEYLWAINYSGRDLLPPCADRDLVVVLLQFPGKLSGMVSITLVKFDNDTLLRSRPQCAT